MAKFHTMPPEEIGTLLTNSYQFPEIVADQLCNLFGRPCTMFPFSERAFREQMSAFHEEYDFSRIVDDTVSDTAVNSRLLTKTNDVERFFAEQLWTEVLHPEMAGFSTHIIATPRRNTTFDSAFHADFSPYWKIEAYLFNGSEPSAEFETIRTAKEQSFESLQDGRYPTITTKEQELTEIQAKSDLFGYPDCCTQQFLTEREKRFDILLDIGSDRIQELQEAYDTPEQLRSAFGETVREQGRTMGELNPESRIIGQLEHINVGKYFEEWSYEALNEFYQRKSQEQLPGFFYAFFTREFYPHHPRCERAIELGHRIETSLQTTTPELVPIYRMSLMTNVFSYLGFDDWQLYRRLLSDAIAD